MSLAVEMAGVVLREDRRQRDGAPIVEVRSAVVDAGQGWNVERQPFRRGADPGALARAAVLPPPVAAGAARLTDEERAPAAPRRRKVTVRGAIWVGWEREI